MRSGLDKPGALPLLALVVFSLLTLVPSLSSIYNLKLADFSFYSGTARRMWTPSTVPESPLTPAEVPLLQDGVTEINKVHPFEPQPWPPAAPPRSRVNLLRTARVGNPAAISASETPVVNKSRLSRESSLRRRARAFRSYFIQHLDDYTFLASFSNRSVVDSNSYPSNQSSLPTDLISNTHNHTEPLGRLPTLRDMCQQAYGMVIDVGRHTFHASEYARSMFKTADKSSTLIPHSTELNYTELHPTSEVQTMGAEDSSDAAAGRHSRELHGSCMAVVIGLVAGIMWF
ncbi:unnamed protein product [Penicillium olsonii]|uniref:Uncharacterized protein n=1 Tax=Penicillium olsonii TaxID=99116 RepID=A0A9W4HRE9_PENOL|nr:unnamed protein product [Penicillium olsonii]CAG8255964.1 unnamed protein product [Penicillium olsonii]